jgi:hypothetical protein
LDQVIAAAERSSSRAKQSSQANWPRDYKERIALGCAYARAGRYQDAEAIAAATDPVGKAVISACLGDSERAIPALEQAILVGPFRIGRELETPELAALRPDPRVKSIRNKVGLPE